MLYSRTNHKERSASSQLFFAERFANHHSRRRTHRTPPQANFFYRKVCMKAYANTEYIIPPQANFFCRKVCLCPHLLSGLRCAASSQLFFCRKVCFAAQFSCTIPHPPQANFFCRKVCAKADVVNIGFDPPQANFFCRKVCNHRKGPSCITASASSQLFLQKGLQFSSVDL